MVLMIDNYDSFTYNVVQYCEELGADLKVIRNDEMSVGEIEKLNPAKIIRANRINIYGIGSDGPRLTFQMMPVFTCIVP